MKQRLLVLLLGIGLVAVLVILNALTYVQKQKENDSELYPNRSTFNPGTTGTQAFFTLLSETGRKPVRWQEAPDGLSFGRNKPSVFVLTGNLRRDVSDKDVASLLAWVSNGGRLIVIDRDPPQELCKTTGNWRIKVSSDPAVELLSVDPSDQKQMTTSTEAGKPVQPTRFTAGVNAIQPSRFAGWVSFEPAERKEVYDYGNGSSRLFEQQPDDSSEPPPTAKAQTIKPDEDDRTQTPSAPVVHIAGNQKNLLVDVTYGSGKIVFLTDPYIVSNAGINIVDNSQLAINLVSTTSGSIAFDEYHQGYGSNANKLFQYFEGTPVIAIFVQCALLIGLIFVSQSRRFARPIPEKEPDRLSKLEYVGAMAELQRRTRAYDLAIENVYTDFRRRTARSLGIDNLTSKHTDFAQLIAERTGVNSADILETMLSCEAIVQGEPTKNSETVALITQIREIEDRLGLTRNRKGNTAR